MLKQTRPAIGHAKNILEMAAGGGRETKSLGGMHLLTMQELMS